AGRSSSKSHKRKPAGGGGQPFLEEGDERDKGLLPPTSNEHSGLGDLVTPTTWEAVLVLALPYMSPYVRAVRASAAPAPGAGAGEGVREREGSVGKAWASGAAVEAGLAMESARWRKGELFARARRSLRDREYSLLPVEVKVALLEVLVDMAYETKRVRSLLEQNMAERMQLESKRREDLIALNRDMKERAAAQRQK
ncbi:unnamed protein product, partial [Discosporangium mesarthrocarpum]